MIAKALSSKLVLLVIGLAAGSGILIPTSYGSFHPVTSSEIQDGTIQTVDLANNAVTSAKIKDGEVKTADIAVGAVASGRIANGAVGTLKIADESITAADIAANAVGSSEIATNAVGASEIAGVSKLIFYWCSISGSESSGSFFLRDCPKQGVDSNDLAVASLDIGSSCFDLQQVKTQTGNVQLFLANDCPSAASFSGHASIIVYDTESIFIPLP
ncbi:MAG: hypothetical protein ACREBU_06830 [Nitrososphaera sp.]